MIGDLLENLQNTRPFYLRKASQLDLLATKETKATGEKPDHMDKKESLE